MQGHILVCLLLSVTLTEGFIFGGSKCPIKKYSTDKYFTGYPLLIHKDFEDRVKVLEKVAKECKVHVQVTGAYYQLPSPSQQVLFSDADIVIGHGFKFELRTEDNSMLCNSLCLSKNPTDLPEARCFLKGATDRGITWSRYNTNVLSDGTYASNPSGYNTLKTDIQTKCQGENFKRQLLRALRQMYDEEQESTQDSDDDTDTKK